MVIPLSALGARKDLLLSMKNDKFPPLTVYIIYIAARRPEQVYAGATSAEFSRKYFFGNVVEVFLKVGVSHIAMHMPTARHRSGGEVIECVSLCKLTVTFNVNWPALIEKLGATVVTWEIEPAGDAVRLTMTEAVLTPSQRLYPSGGRSGWSRSRRARATWSRPATHLLSRWSRQSRCWRR